MDLALSNCWCGVLIFIFLFSSFLLYYLIRIFLSASKYTILSVVRNHGIDWLIYNSLIYCRHHCTTFEKLWVFVGSQREDLHPWQRSWGRKLDIRKGRIEPQESPWKFSSIYPHKQSLPTLLLCALTYTCDFTGGCPPPPILEKELT